MRYGRAIRHLWELADDAAFLNHGSFGACPREVLAEQDRIRRRMESAPDAFFRNDVMPRDGATALRSAAATIARFVNAEPRQLVFVENATLGIQAVLRSIPLVPGEHVLITDHTYNAVRLMLEARCAETGAAPVVARIGIPESGEEIAEKIVAAVTQSTRLAILDHITSPTGLVFPLERILPALRARGVRVIVDGAHGIGQVPLDLAALRPDWYVSNLHKWLFAPKGTAFLYAADEVAPMTRPNVVSHYHDRGFPDAFDYTGTRDNSGWLAAPAALRFFEHLVPTEARAYQRQLLEFATECLARVDVRPIAPMALAGTMRAFHLPQVRAATPDDATDVMRTFWERDRIQAHASVFDGKLLTRISGQVYVDEEEVDRYRAALDRHGWPGRTG
jgi:isopenicillin-N epimerase